MTWFPNFGPAVVTPAVTALVAGVLAVLTAWAKERLERHDRAARRRRAIGQAKEEVELIDQWIKAYASVASAEDHDRARARAREHLERAYAVLLDPVMAARSGTEDRFDLIIALKRMLVAVLLWRKLGRWTAEVMRVVYYMFLVLTLSAFTVTVAGTDPDKGGALGGVLFIAILALLAWRQTNRLAPPPSSPAAPGRVGS